MLRATGQSTIPLAANVTAATRFMQNPLQFFSPFMRWMFTNPMKPSAASMRMPTPAPK